ncbi:L-lactate dehydrogenase [Thermosipho ferrireducens]|uniref:L-lactate dehydrogenase n=1 Tax=Thermosipho ferrireducens TaxID=2571116 RepID=A0ABX7S9L8_9BACT|nr:L-lactate dehydrogenase [Thermosipho ferrireducens]QTA38073.1 L-lactate dehydrogenase [Thermosipho ferrireducens]
MKISIFGAGRVGTSVAFSILHKAVADEIVIVDINLEKAEGEALDLYHGTPFFKRCDVKAGTSRDIKNSDIVIITAGAAQKPGETRLDLTVRNAKIMKDIASQIKEYAPDSLIINITNPVDVLTYLLWKETGFESGRVIGTGTILDTARFRSLVARNCDVSPTSVHAYIIGEHGDSEFVVWSNAMIGGVQLSKFCSFCEKESCTSLEILFEETKNAAYKIIQKKGATNYAIGAVTSTLVESIVKDEKRVWTPSVLIDDIYIGYPAVIGRDGVKRIVKIDLDEEEQGLFERSKNIVREFVSKII